MRRKGLSIVLLGLLMLLSLFSQAQSTVVSRNAKASFFSSAPIEDIEAHSSEGTSAINLQTGKMFFKIRVKSFQFEHSLMQSHFNSDYLESDTYPFASFSGKINDSIFLQKDGKDTVTVSGKLTIHGVTKTYSGPVILQISGSNIQAQAIFKVQLAEYNIKIPSILSHNIAEVVDVTVTADYQPVKEAKE